MSNTNKGFLFPILYAYEMVQECTGAVDYADYYN